MTSRKDFKVGDLVWAKMKGFPFWPGEIIRPPKTGTQTKIKKGLPYVKFFGSNNYACIAVQNIHLHDKQSVNSYFSVGNKSKLLQTAVKTIMKKSGLKYPEHTKMLFTRDGQGTKKSPKPKASSTRHPLTKPEMKLEDSKNLYMKSIITSVATSESFDSEECFVSSTKISENLENHESSPAESSQNIKHCNSSPKTSSGNLNFENYSLSTTKSSENLENYLSPTKLMKSSRDDYKYVIRNTSPNFKFNATSEPVENVDCCPESPISVVAENMHVERPRTPELDIESINEALIAKNVTPTSKKIGFLGLGKMGQGIVKNLLQAGHFVTAWNRTAEKCDPFIALGAHKGLTPADVVKKSDITFCCVSGVDTIKGLVFGANGVIKGMENCIGDKGYVEMSFIEPQLSQVIADEVACKKGRYLEVSLIGTRQESFEGSLLILAAGDQELFNDCQSCLDTIGRDVLFTGPIGTALKLSIMYNTFLGTVYGSLAEALNLTRRLGLDQKVALKVFQLGLLSEKGIADKGHSMISNDYTSNIPLHYVQQCMQSGLMMGLKVSQPTLVLSAANEIYKHAKLLGFASHDVSAVYEGIKQ